MTRGQGETGSKVGSRERRYKMRKEGRRAWRKKGRTGMELRAEKGREEASK